MVSSPFVDLGLGAQAGPTNPMYAPPACSGPTSIACSPVFRTPRVGAGKPWAVIQRTAPSMPLVR